MPDRSVSLARRFSGPEAPTGCAPVIVLVTSVYLVLGMVAFVTWGATDDARWVENFFRIPGALLLVWLAAIEFWFCNRVREHFSADEALHSAWVLIGISAFFHLIGAIFSQLLGLNGGMNPLGFLPGWSPATAALFRAVGLILGGTFRFGLLAAGLFSVVHVYRRAGFLSRLRPVDWVLLAMAFVYVVQEFATLAVALRAGKHPGLFEIASWPVNPLLLMLLAEGLLLHRSVQRMGSGWITRCWGSMSMGVFLVLLGNLGTWMFNYGYLAWPWNAVIWYVWLPAASAFAAAPVYQLEAICQARAVPEADTGAPTSNGA